MREPPLVLALAAVCALSLAGPPGARAQLLPEVDQYAQAIASLTTRRWGGPRTPWPAESARPAADGEGASSRLLPLSVHGARGVPREAVTLALAEVEAMRVFLDSHGWPTPPPDADLGGSSDFDVYLVPRLGSPYEPRSDGPVPWSYLDAVTAHAVVDASMPTDRIAACAAEAYAAGLLLTMDPAEAPAFRRATATYLAWSRTGRFDGCVDDVARHQREPFRAYVSAEEPDDAGGALLFAMLDARHDGGSGTFVRELWNMARQRTWEGDALRASPDLWMALDRALDLADTELLPTLTDFAVARFFFGDAARERGLAFPSLAGLGSDATVPLAASIARADLPEHLPPPPDPLAPFGASYALVDVRGAPPRSRLRIWLRGEFGVRWGLVAVGLDADGRERGRVAAPPRTADWRSYVPYEIPEGVTDVLVVVVNLSSRTPDADVPDENDRRFFLIVDDETD